MHAGRMKAVPMRRGRSKQPTAHPPDAWYFVFEVWNHGEPIPADSLDKVFEPFWRHSISHDR
jgi:signal transduction histidine kinase